MNFSPALMVLQGSLCAAMAAPWSLSQIVDSLSARYDRIESYRADAAVFEYDG